MEPTIIFVYHFQRLQNQVMYPTPEPENLEDREISSFPNDRYNTEQLPAAADDKEDSSKSFYNSLVREAPVSIPTTKVYKNKFPVGYNEAFVKEKSAKRNNPCKSTFFLNLCEISIDFINFCYRHVAMPL